jgi:hypothetical protein
MPEAERDAERAAGVAGRRLNPDLVEHAVAQDRPFATQLSATPPAMQRSRMPVSRRANRAIFSIASSVTS